MRNSSNHNQIKDDLKAIAANTVSGLRTISDLFVRSQPGQRELTWFALCWVNGLGNQVLIEVFSTNNPRAFNYLVSFPTYDMTGNVVDFCIRGQWDDLNKTFDALSALKKIDYVQPKHLRYLGGYIGGSDGYLHLQFCGFDLPRDQYIDFETNNRTLFRQLKQQVRKT